MSQLGNIKQDLISHWKIISMQWDSTKSKWKDAVRDFFEVEYWREWEEEMPIFLKILEDLQITIDNAEAKTNYNSNEF
jgi:hypothetical protein